MAQQTELLNLLVQT
jgi:hypothetical protein